MNEQTLSQPLRDWRLFFREIDPRIPVAGILFTYLVLGLTVLGFNRSPYQAITTTISCCVLEIGLTYFFKRKWVFPLSAMITSFSLSFLLNYSHDFFLLFVPLFFAIGSKYVFQFNGRHGLNPAMVGVSFSLLFAHELVTAAPAYQWNGIATMSLFIIMLGLTFVIPKVNRHWLVMSFLFFFTLQTFLRAFIMRHHLPFETLFLGTLSSPSFFIFTFFMITDPATSPKDKKQQIIVGFFLATVDLLLHLKQSYYTFFFSALIVGSTRLIWNHLKVMRLEGLKYYFINRFWRSGYYRQPLTLLIMGLVGTTVYSQVIRPGLPSQHLNWKFEKVPANHSGLNADKQGDTYQTVDPRVQHIIKWILSVGDAAAVADFDNDGKQDIFLTNMVKEPTERAQLYRNLGEGRFEKILIPELKIYSLDQKQYGVISNATFVDFDNDGDQDLFLSVGFGHSILLQNQLKEKGKAEFKDITTWAGLDQYTNSVSATFADFNRDGLLDLLILNVWPENLPHYETPHQLNLFHLPQAEYEGDDRPFDFMHDSWHMSNNGGVNLLYLQTPEHKFEKQDSAAWGLPEARWSLAVSAVDFNRDGWTDIYIANDFGPDDLYYNHAGKKFENIKGTIFGSIGRDTYKGMNASVADFDRDGWLGVYISNVHHALQAEGSLLWKFSPSPDHFKPKVEEVASEKSVLNENRFGWGATATDFNNDGWVDIAQANGMVDDTYDKRDENCSDYWYVNEKIARSPPRIHRFANKWGDIRGMCIYGKEQNRVYLNHGTKSHPQYEDVATQLGVTELTNSRGAISADFDNVGRRDLLFTHQFAAPTFYRNRFIGSDLEKPNWIGFTFESQEPDCNREAIGTRVELSVLDRKENWSMAQEVQVVSGFSSQSDKRLHFGLGRSASEVNAKVIWCGKYETQYSNLKMDQYHRLVFKK